MPYKRLLSSLGDTKALAAQLAGLSKIGDVITLQGDLGAGKSEFARAFIKSLAGENTIVPSPTFTIMEQYNTPAGLISHFDLYRIEGAHELTELGFEEALLTSISLIEWPERLQGLHLDNALQIEIIADAATEERVVSLTPDTSWQDRLRRVLD